MSEHRFDHFPRNHLHHHSHRFPDQGFAFHSKQIHKSQMGHDVLLQMEPVHPNHMIAQYDHFRP